MASLIDIVRFCDEQLASQQFKDYCPNGLQVEGKNEVQKIVTGVTASQALIEAAIKNNADLLLVHHGFFWRGENPQIVGLKKNRIAALIRNDISLLVYHLPLDAHKTLGNNARLAELLDVEIESWFGSGNEEIAAIGKLQSAVNTETFRQKVSVLLNREAQLLSQDCTKMVQKVGLCTGAAQSYFENAIDLGVDVFITGEISEQIYHLVMEAGVDFISAGHHATEKFGVQAVGNLVAKTFQIEHEFIDIVNPI